MANKPQMVPGFNHNIKHQGQIFHIQTEDSGATNPHIITHLFVGGNILATKKTSYADIVQADNLHEIVKELMQEQHKAMLRNLVNGVYNEISAASGAALGDEEPAPVAPASQPPPAAKPATRPVQPAVSRPPAAAAASRPAQPAASQPPPATRPAQPAAGQPRAVTSQPPVATRAPGLPAPPVVLTPKVPPAVDPALEPGKFPLPAAKTATRPAQPAASQPPPATQSAQPAASQPTQTASPVGFSRPITGTQIHRPPAPERVPVIKKPTTKVTLRPAPAGAVPTAQPAAQAPPVQNLPPHPTAQPQAAANLPPEVLAARRLAEKPKPKDTSGPTIFCENLISEKSLDEVILGYLAGNEDGGG